MQLANCLAFLRVHRDNISQQALADRAGLSRPLVSLIESGKCNPSWHTLIALSIALKMPLSSMIRIAELLNEGTVPDSPNIQKLLKYDTEN